ncbi:MAG: LysR family transcriptional regulator [Deltaproteobacteria bacterium]|nr:LysR family transcriptional regulator [Deltaproteobacteria bacterium]
MTNASPGPVAPLDLPRWLIFAAVARRGSFTAAARELGLSKSAVSEHVSGLEASVGARLLERTTRKVSPTQVGLLALEGCAVVESGLRDLAAALEEHRESPSGTLRVATTHDLGARFVLPAAAAVAARHPGVRVDVSCDDAVADLVGGGFDLAVRLGRPAESGFVLRRLAEVDEPLVGSPELAERYPDARRPRDLTGAPFVRHALVHRGRSWAFQARGERDAVVPEVRAQANTGEGVRALLLAGLGFGCLPEYLLAEDLGRGALLRVCPGWTLKRVTLYALLPSAKAPRRVGLFLEELGRALARVGLTRPG